MSPFSSLSVSLAPLAFSFHWPFHSGHKHIQAFEGKKAFLSNLPHGHIWALLFQPLHQPPRAPSLPCLPQACQAIRVTKALEGRVCITAPHALPLPLQSTLAWPWPWLSTLLFGPKGRIPLATTPCTLPVSPRPAWPLSSFPPPNGDSSVSLPGPTPFSLLTHTLGFSSHL